MTTKRTIEVGTRRAIVSELKNHCHLSGDYDMMEVIEWGNGEGYDVNIDRKNGSDKFSLTYGEWRLLQVLMNWEGD